MTEARELLIEAHLTRPNWDAENVRSTMMEDDLSSLRINGGIVLDAITTALRQRDEARALALEEVAGLVRKRSEDYRALADEKEDHWSEERAIANVLHNLDTPIRALSLPDRIEG